MAQVYILEQVEIMDSVTDLIKCYQYNLCPLTYNSFLWSYNALALIHGLAPVIQTITRYRLDDNLSTGGI